MKLQETSLNLPEKEYHEYPCLSFSALQKFDREGYESLNTLFDQESTPSLTFGSLVDCLITQNRTEFNERFAIADLPALSETMQTIVNHLLSERQEKQFALIPDNVLVDAANIYEYYKKWKDETRVNKIRESCSAYYNFLKANEGKQLIAKTDYEDAQKAVETLKSSNLTGPYFRENTEFDVLERIYQLQLISEEPLSGIKFKGMLDLVIIDHDHKVIYPCDLKTTKSIYSFEESFYKYRYYLQASMYVTLLRDTIAKSCPELQEYMIAPYRFIAIDRNAFQPIVFEWLVTDKVTDKFGQSRKTWQELLVELDWALKNKDKQVPMNWWSDLRDKGTIMLRNYYK